MKKVKFFPFTEKNKKKIYFFSVNTNNISSHVLKISAISLVLRTREIDDIFNTFDEIYLVFTSKVNILCLLPPKRTYYLEDMLLTYETEFVLFLAVLENSVLPMGWDSSHETSKVMSVIYERLLRAVTKTPNDVQNWPTYNVYCKKNVINYDFPII